MKQWLARMSGDSFDLEELSYWFPTGPIHCIQRADGFYLAGETLNALDDDSGVHEAAVAALDEFSAIVALLAPGFTRPSVDAVFVEDEKGRRAFVRLEGNIRGRSKVRAELSVSGMPKPSETTAQQLLKGARARPEHSILVVLWADPIRTWPRLYRTFEEIERILCRDVDKAGLTSGEQRKRFARSANAAEIAGKDSRHALGQFVPPKNSMTLQEGTAFIAVLIQHVFSQASVP